MKKGGIVLSDCLDFKAELARQSLFGPNAWMEESPGFTGQGAR